MMRENGMLLNTSKALLVGSLVWVGVAPFAQSELKTFQPGDVITTGTPDGAEHYREPPTWLVPGDEVEIEITGIGVLRNRVVDE